jgi:hypothetical protein
LTAPIFGIHQSLCGYCQKVCWQRIYFSCNLLTQVSNRCLNNCFKFVNSSLSFLLFFLPSKLQFKVLTPFSSSPRNISVSSLCSDNEDAPFIAQKINYLKSEVSRKMKLYFLGSKLHVSFPRNDYSNVRANVSFGLLHFVPANVSM